jgi:hypothetical protein
MNGGSAALRNGEVERKAKMVLRSGGGWSESSGLFWGLSNPIKTTTFQFSFRADETGLFSGLFAIPGPPNPNKTANRILRNSLRERDGGEARNRTKPSGINHSQRF